jgi:hypothetical protein
MQETERCEGKGSIWKQPNVQSKITLNALVPFSSESQVTLSVLEL